MPPDPLIQSDRLRNVAVAVVLVTLFAGTLVTVHRYAAGRDWANLAKTTTIDSDGLTVEAPAHWQATHYRPLPLRYRQLAVLRDPRDPYRQVVIAALPATSVAQTPDAALKFARLAVPMIGKILQGASLDRGKTRHRIGKFISARVTGTAGSEIAPHQYVVAVLTVDGRRYWAFALTTNTMASRKDRIYEASNDLIDRIIASATGGRFVAADARAMANLGLSFELPSNLQAYIGAGDNPPPALMIIPNTGTGDLLTLEISPLPHTDEIPDPDHPWGRKWIEERFFALHQARPDEKQITADKIGEWQLWRFMDQTDPNRNDIRTYIQLVQTGDNHGVQMIQTNEPGNFDEALAVQAAVISALQSGNSPTRHEPAEESQNKP